MPNHWKLKRGFTLIELLTVIAIIGILASIGLASYTNAQAKGRDSRRKRDLEEIKKALELYYNDNNSYPWGGWLTSASGGNWIPNLVPTYIRQLPIDPKNTTSGNYVYEYSSDCGGQTNSKSYILVARLENSSDPQIFKTPQYDGCTNFGQDWAIWTINSNYYVQISP